MFIVLKLGNYTIHHGYDENNKAILEEIKVDGYTEKIVKLDRILSVNETTILISSTQDRQIYWEYDGNLKDIWTKLRNNGFLIE